MTGVHREYGLMSCANEYRPTSSLKNLKNPDDKEAILDL